MSQISEKAIPCTWIRRPYQMLICSMLLLSRFSHVPICVTPETAAHQTPLSLGFSRWEHWSGLSFPSPMHKSEKGKWSRSVVSDSWWPHGLQPTRLLLLNICSTVRQSRKIIWPQISTVLRSRIPAPAHGTAQCLGKRTWETDCLDLNSGSTTYKEWGLIKWG